MAMNLGPPDSVGFLDYRMFQKSTSYRFLNFAFGQNEVLSEGAYLPW